MKRRLLLIEGDKVEQGWMTEQLRDRFRSIHMTCVASLDDANRVIIDHGCDLIITSLTLQDGESPIAIIHALQAYAQGVPIIALTNTKRDDESLLDVAALGVRHILFKEDLQKDYSRIVSVIIETIKELATREVRHESFTEQVQALSHKVWDIDGRAKAIEMLLGTLTLSVDKFAQTIEKRGGLEDRLKELEDNKSLAVRIVIALAGLIATCGGAGITAIVTYYLKK